MTTTATAALAALGWTEAAPMSLMSSADPISGGIIDHEIVSGQWFVIFNDDAHSMIDGLATREDAARAALALIAPDHLPEPAAMTLEDAKAADSRVGWHYNTRNGEGPDHVVISDTSTIPGCVTVRNGGGQTFPLDRNTIDNFAAPAGMIWDRQSERFIQKPAHATIPA